MGITWAPTPEDPSILGGTIDGSPFFAYVAEHESVLAASADYDLPHARISWSWEVQHEDTGATVRSGHAVTLLAAKLEAATALRRAIGA